MTQFGFLIDNRKCIGCHACTVACKSENEVPLGVNRTWVKYTEKGAFPNTRRYFQVTRCNHCANPPCVRICPVAAMYQRADGIVEFDASRCIGCKACMQACPYDAIYIDPASHTAAKCHFCAHRTDVGLEPACVVVCPEHAILAGDIDNPDSEIARAVATQQVRVRKPEQGTQPKLFYIDAEEISIVPTLAKQEHGMLWADWPDQGKGDWRGPLQHGNGTQSVASALVQSAAAPRETYNVPHKIPWHWQVPAYLAAKSIGAGVFIVSALGVALGWFPSTPFFTTIATLIALIFIGLNTGLLVWDLDRPDRFWTILARPQWRSWLARGAFILVGFSVVGGLYFIGQLVNLSLSNLLLWPGVILAVLSAIYTAFLFAQAEGRDLWQSTLLPWQMFVQALMAGSALLLIAGALLGISGDATRVLSVVFGVSVIVNLLITIGGEFGVPHASQVAAMAAHAITRGRYARWYWASIAGGLLLPLAMLVLVGTPIGLAAAGGLSLLGLFAYEWAFVMAPQEIPNN
jgi:Fe-S-cluster-containing dehydrogenase component/formate-dependent nitrite reductase membrane component NrfD